MTRLGPRASASLAATLLIVPIVALAATVSSKPASAPAHAASKPAAQQRVPIDINSASKAELKTLPGIGDAEAEKIIAGRPYLSKADLVTKGLIPAGVVQSIRHEIVALPPAKGAPQAKPHGKS